jgi:polypeptide N-acetylgalactosaminyltransferase
LLRTAHSVYNRSPPSLLKEIILVNDHSTKEFLYNELKDYVAHHFDGKVKIVELPERSGLIWARMAGAREASGDVLIFLDSHTEPNTNWFVILIDIQESVLLHHIFQVTTTFGTYCKKL